LIGEIYEPGDEWIKFELDILTLKLKWQQYEY
jgi:hypothetical protein